MDLKRRWDGLWRRLGADASADEFRKLARFYTKRHRHYHNLAHVRKCLEHFDAISAFCERPDAVEAAIWFHDVIYRPYWKGNEAASAEWAARSLEGGRLGDGFIQEVRQLILATAHAGPPDGPDQEWIVDIDLAILGAEPDAYHLYASQIRREYRLIPHPTWRKLRRRVLAGFLRRRSIYATPLFRERFEERARRNLYDEKARL